MYNAHATICTSGAAANMHPRLSFPLRNTSGPQISQRDLSHWGLPRATLAVVHMTLRGDIASLSLASCGIAGRQSVLLLHVLTRTRSNSGLACSRCSTHPSSHIHRATVSPPVKHSYHTGPPELQSSGHSSAQQPIPEPSKSSDLVSSPGKPYNQRG